jgi:hypothetical protein
MLNIETLLIEPWFEIAWLSGENIGYCLKLWQSGTPVFYQEQWKEYIVTFIHNIDHIASNIFTYS